MGLKVEDDPPSSGSVADADDSTDRLCRVCHCVEPDLRGHSALAFLGILPPPSSPDEDADDVATATATNNNVLEFVSPRGEIFVCTAATTDLESGPLHHHHHLMDLGCSCKNDLALAHYACALKWFITHGSTVCEICGHVAVNVRPADFNKVLASLKEYEALRERTSTGDLSYLHYGADSGVDPDAVAAIRRQRLSEISSWFNPQNSHLAISQGQTEQTPASPSNNSIHHGAVVTTVVHTRWSLEGTGVFLAIGLGVIVLAWLVAPHVGKKAAVICLHMLLGGLCALTIIISLRFVSFPKDPIWIYAMLGDLVCVLVPGFWSLGITDPQYTLLMRMEIMMYMHDHKKKEKFVIGVTVDC
uniref:OSJNBb0020J19.13 protein n=1 Tax=Oryza sativa subsp. japonica TaxID=39947 RepID=Q7XK97_ORYSJ|nr:OSJNBb0020J19.13 [Oryza sativa Japonica Group]